MQRCEQQKSRLRGPIGELQDESERLRFDYLRSAIEFNITVACYSEAKPNSGKLRASCWSVASRNYQLLRQLMAKPPFANMEIAALLPRIERLEEVLSALESGRETPPTLPLPRAVPAAPAKTNGARKVEGLTPREAEVLIEIANGHSTKEIAYRLGMSFKTAACHRYRLMDKLGFHDTVSLVRHAVRSGFVAF
ncbi:MAG TPA: LuxR C-terminal-related transcriptional regulator [Candidatus Solibacter sp.]|nr:LuxR C-terminal-related transcriptional regulator [Candidatus Solibacter sp.]